MFELMSVISFRFRSVIIIVCGKTGVSIIKKFIWFWKAVHIRQSKAKAAREGENLRANNSNGIIIVGVDLDRVLVG